VIVLGIGIALISFIEKRTKIIFRKWSFAAVANGVILISLFIMSKIEFLVHGKRTITSYISGWDDVCFEFRRKGVLIYGPFDNLAQSNLKHAYYWFADAWSGSLTS